jgi:hypothetical protein
MELTITVIGMILAFIAGAYVRAPFIVWTHKLPERAQSIRLDHESRATKAESYSTSINDCFTAAAPKKDVEKEAEAEAEKKRMAQLKNAWDYVGKEQPHGNQ